MPFPQVIATACLHLAAKIQEAPKPIREVCLQCERVRHLRHAEMLELLRDTVGKDWGEEPGEIRYAGFRGKCGILYGAVLRDTKDRDTGDTL